jgi:hypothetical protein
MIDEPDKIKFQMEEYKILFENYHKKNSDMRNITQIGITGLAIVYSWLTYRGLALNVFALAAWLIPVIISYIALQYNIGLRRTMDVDRLYLMKIEELFSFDSLMGRERFFDSIIGDTPWGGIERPKWYHTYARFKIWSALLTVSMLTFVSRLVVYVETKYSIHIPLISNLISALSK